MTQNLEATSQVADVKNDSSASVESGSVARETGSMSDRMSQFLEQSRKEKATPERSKADQPKAAPDSAKPERAGVKHVADAKEAKPEAVEAEATEAKAETKTVPLQVLTRERDKWKSELANERIARRKAEKAVELLTKEYQAIAPQVRRDETQESYKKRIYELETNAFLKDLEPSVKQEIENAVQAEEVQTRQTQEFEALKTQLATDAESASKTFNEVVSPYEILTIKSQYPEMDLMEIAKQVAEPRLQRIAAAQKPAPAPKPPARGGRVSGLPTTSNRSQAMADFLRARKSINE